MFPLSEFTQQQYIDIRQRMFAAPNFEVSLMHYPDDPGVVQDCEGASVCRCVDADTAQLLCDIVNAFGNVAMSLPGDPE